MSRVLFDSRKHALESFAFTFATDPGAIRLEADKPRQCRMRYAIGGEPEMGDPRRFRMYPEDAALCVGNAKKRLSAQPKGGIPQLFEHGWGMYGGKAGGYWLDLSEEGGDLWALVTLDERTWEEAVDPGMNWFGRSMGFSGWVDPDGFIRPADIFEGSFTNFPAMKGLGTVEPMAQLEQRFSSRSFVAMGGLFVPPRGLVGPDGKPAASAFSEGEAASGGPLGHVTNPSPEMASNGKEQETMKLSAETLKLLGFAEGADPTQEQIDKAFQERLSSRAAAPPDPKPGAGEGTPVTLAMVEQLVADKSKREIDAMRAAFEAQDRDRQIDAVFAEFEGVGGKPGRVTAAEREEWTRVDEGQTLSRAQKLGPVELRKILSRYSVVAPTSRVYQPGDDAALLGTPAGAPASIAEMCEQAGEVYRYARRNGVTPEAARAALRVN